MANEGSTIDIPNGSILENVVVQGSLRLDSPLRHLIVNLFSLRLFRSVAWDKLLSPFTDCSNIRKTYYTKRCIRIHLLSSFAITRSYSKKAFMVLAVSTPVMGHEVLFLPVSYLFDFCLDLSLVFLPSCHRGFSWEICRFVIRIMYNLLLFRRWDVVRWWAIYVPTLLLYWVVRYQENPENILGLNLSSVSVWWSALWPI